MATERLAMHQAREILRQKLTLKRSHRDVMSAVGVSMGTVSGVTCRATALGLDWVAIEVLDDEALDVRLYGPRCTTRDTWPSPDAAARTWAPTGRDAPAPPRYLGGTPTATATRSSATCIARGFPSRTDDAAVHVTGDRCSSITRERNRYVEPSTAGMSSRSG
jgi:hypothetical protein